MLKNFKIASLFCGINVKCNRQYVKNSILSTNKSGNMKWVFLFTQFYYTLSVITRYLLTEGKRRNGKVINALRSTTSLCPMLAYDKNATHCLRSIVNAYASGIRNRSGIENFIANILKLTIYFRFKFFIRLFAVEKKKVYLYIFI